jgi:hypothetical protein
MSTRTSNHVSTLIPTHGGLERVIERTGALQSVINTAFSAKQLPTCALSLTIMAVVTATERAMDAIDTGFAFEWIVLSVVAMATFGLLANTVTTATQAALARFTEYAARSRQARADETLWATALTDPRVMNDILAAQGHSDDALIDVVPPSKRDARADRTDRTDRDDGMAALAPWTQLGRYY